MLCSKRMMYIIYLSPNRILHLANKLTWPICKPVRPDEEENYLQPRVCAASHHCWLAVIGGGPDRLWRRPPSSVPVHKGRWEERRSGTTSSSSRCLGSDRSSQSEMLSVSASRMEDRRATPSMAGVELR